MDEMVPPLVVYFGLVVFPLKVVVPAVAKPAPQRLAGVILPYFPGALRQVGTHLDCHRTGADLFWVLRRRFREFLQAIFALRARRVPLPHRQV